MLVPPAMKSLRNWKSMVKRPVQSHRRMRSARGDQFTPSSRGARGKHASSDPRSALRCTGTPGPPARGTTPPTPSLPPKDGAPFAGCPEQRFGAHSPLSPPPSSFRASSRGLNPRLLLAYVVCGCVCVPMRACAVKEGGGRGHRGATPPFSAPKLFASSSSRIAARVASTPGKR